MTRIRLWALLIEYITDQLNNGVYKTTVKIDKVKDAITGEVKETKVATLIPDPDAPGGFKRSESSPFKYYGITIGAESGGQVSVNKIDYSDKVKQQIAQQQEANMLIQTSKAKAAQAKWEQERIKATEVTKAEQEKEVSRLAAEKAEYDKKKVIAQGEAEAAANRAKVAAGLTPQERAEWDYKTKVGVAEAISKVTLPKIVTTGGNGNGNSNQAMDAMGFKMLLDVAEKLSK